MTLEIVLQSLILACAVYLVLVYSSYLVLMAVSFVETRDRRREERIDDLAAIGVPPRRASASFSRRSTRERASRCGPISRARVRGIRGDRRQRRLDRRDARSAARWLDLVPVEEMSRDVVETEPILAYYRSEREPRLRDRQGKRREGRCPQRRAQPRPLPLRVRGRRRHGLRPRRPVPGDAHALPRSGDDRRPDELRRDRGGSVTRASGASSRHPRIEAAGPIRRSTPCIAFSTPSRSTLDFMLCAIGAFQCGARPARRARWLGARVHLRGHRAHVPGPQGAARAPRSVSGRLHPGPRRRDRGAEHGSQARGPARAMAA